MHDGRIPESLIGAYRRRSDGTYRARHLFGDDALVAALGAALAVALLLGLAWVVELVGT